MKKILALLLCAVLAICLVGCGAATETEDTDTSDTAAADTAEAAADVTEGNNEIAQLENEGYARVMSSYDDGKWFAILQKDDTYLKVTADFPAEAEEAYDNIDFFADDFEDQTNAIIYSLGNVQTEDITDRVPTQEELDSYIGKSMGELEEEGYENTGYCGDDESGAYAFSFEGPEYCLDVYPEEGVVIENVEDYGEDEISALVIGSVSFNSFSFGFLYE